MGAIISGLSALNLCSTLPARYCKQMFYRHLSPAEGQEKCHRREDVDYMTDYSLKNTHAQPVDTCT